MKTENVFKNGFKILIQNIIVFCGTKWYYLMVLK